MSQEPKEVYVFHAWSSVKMKDQPSEEISTQKTGKTGMLGFTIVWVGQMLSLLGTNMTGFALAIWMYEITAEFPGYSVLVSCLLQFCALDSNQSFSRSYS